MPNIARQPCDEGVMRSALNPAPCKPDARPWVLVATIVGSSMAFIDGTVVNVALPALQADLRASITDVQWIVEAYSLFLAALILVGGSLGDHFGRRRVFATGITLFAIASMACGFSGDITQLILARALQGVGGAMLVPGSLAMISVSFSGDQRGRAIGTWSGFTAIASGLGPVLGGWLIENVSWRWIFFINLPLAVIVLIVLFWRVPESRDESVVGGLDGWGALLVTVGLGTTIYALIKANSLGLGHPQVLTTLAAGGLVLLGFVVVEVRGANPMMPIGLFRSRTFSGANLLTLLLYAAISGAMFFVPFNLIQVQGYSATAAGATFLPLIVIMFLLSRWSGGLVHRYGAKLPLMLGPGIAALGFALFAVPGIGGSYWLTFFPAVVVLGVGMAISVAPLTTVVLAAVESRYAGVASGINNAASQVAGLLAIALLGIVALDLFNQNLDNALATLRVPLEVQQLLDPERIKLAGAQVPAQVTGPLRAALENAIAEAFVASFRSIMLIAACLALTSALTAWLLVKDTRRSNVVAEGAG
ncbi:MFS transporter [Leptolyngbya sp. FACHB-261]|uniref:MFS transporter n=1 Tax=Leptolyngbya sp. FACHB-261 TaxID=2692806 RepID=UPI0016861B92|nr:MFS transporter [Leptolyngbya sp. FACHB-261]MBD2103664.1 MFS transporter [Leptolyngbya sp. FACHB-261]